MSSKVFVVFGATGKQGGSVIQHVLKDSKAASTFTIRAITRDVNKPAAAKLREQGVETVSASLDDKESLKAAFKSAHAVYAVTNYWDHLSTEREIQQGKDVVDAAKAAGVKHLIFSVLYNITEISKGEFKHVYHFDSKSEIKAYMEKSGVPSTSFLPGFYMDNLVQSIHPSGEGQFTFTAPYSVNAPIPLLDATKDTGLFVKAILMNEEKTLGKDVLAATDYYTPKQIMKEFEEATGYKISFNQITGEQYTGVLKQNGMPDFVAQELLENMTMMEPYGYYGKRSLEWSHSLLDSKPTTFKEFAQGVSQWK